MKSVLLAFLLTFPLPSIAKNGSPAAAAAEGPSASGAGVVSLGDSLKRRFEFQAVTREDGSVTGYITLAVPAELPEQDVDGTGEAGLEGSPAGLEVTVEVDSLKVRGRRAVLGGVVSSTNLPRYVGVRVLLAVEDRGEGAKPAARDRLTWGVYRGAAARLAADAEDPGAEGALVAEREFDAERFPLSSFSLSRIDEGDIRVSP